MLVTAFPELALGDVRNGLADEAVARLLEVAQAGSCDRSKCQACPTAGDCAGGCLAINYATTGIALSPPEFYCQTISTISGAWHEAWSDMASNSLVQQDL
jgi:radical SAM protein with 4Fe4S-binding SPASM domain